MLVGIRGEGRGSSSKGGGAPVRLEVRGGAPVAKGEGLQ